MDPPLVGCGIQRDINYLAKESLFRFPLIGSLLKSWNAVPINLEGNGSKGLKIILKRLLRGNAIILFPEGSRTWDGKIQNPKSGIALTVIKSEAPVVPVRVFGTFEAYGRKLTLPRPYSVAVRYGKPMNFKDLREEAKSCSKNRLKEIYSHIAQDIMNAIESLELK